MSDEKPDSPLDKIVKQRLQDRAERGVTTDTAQEQRGTGNAHKEIRRMIEDRERTGYAAQVRRKHRVSPSGFGTSVSPAETLYQDILDEKIATQGGGKYTPEELFDKLSSSGHIYRLSGRGNSGLYIFSNEDGAVASEMEKIGIFDTAPKGPFTKEAALKTIQKNPAAIMALMPPGISEDEEQKINGYEARIILEKLERKGHIFTPLREDLVLDNFSSAAASSTLTPAEKETFLAAFNPEMKSDLVPFELDKNNVEKSIRKRISGESASMLYTHLYNIRNALPDTHPVKIKAEEILMDDAAVTIPTQAMIDAVEKSGCRSGKKNVNGHKCTVVHPFELLDSIMKSPECFEPLSNDTISLTPTDIVLGLAKRGYIYDVMPAGDTFGENELRVKGEAATELLERMGITLGSQHGKAAQIIPETALEKLIGVDDMDRVFDEVKTIRTTKPSPQFQR